MYPRRRALPTRPPRPVWTWLVPLILAGLAVWGGVRWLTRPQNPPLQAAALSRTVEQDWAALQALGPRPVGTPGHDRAADWLGEQLRTLGYRVTEQPVSLSRPFDQGGSLKVAGQTFPVQALYGTASGQQQGRLVRVPPDVTAEQLQDLSVQGQIVVVPCGRTPLTRVADDVVGAGASGLVFADTCAIRTLHRVTPTIPMGRVTGKAARKVLQLAGRPALLGVNVQVREVQGRNLIASRVGASPEVLLGAHFDTVDGTLGANDNASGVLAVLAAARRAAGTPLAERAWFVLFDAEEDGMVGSWKFARDYSYPLRQTRAMVNLDMVGVAAQPLGVAAHEELLPLVRSAGPALRVFTEEPVGSRVTFGRSFNITGRSDHVSFKRSGIRTLFLHRGLDSHQHAPSDRGLDPALVRDTTEMALRLMQKALDTPWTPREPCGIAGRNCRY